MSLDSIRTLSALIEAGRLATILRDGEWQPRRA